MEFWIGVITVTVAIRIGIWLHNKFFTDGTLLIDRSDPAKDIYRIELKDLDSLSKKKRIVIKVDNNADLSHE